MTKKELQKYSRKHYRDFTYAGPLSKYGCTAGTGLLTIKTAWKNLPRKFTGPFRSCYASYITSGRELVDNRDWKFYVTYPSLPIWFPKVIEEFNNFYNNLNVEILDSKNIYLNFEEKEIKRMDYNSARYKSYTGYSVKYNDKKGQVKLCIPLLKFNYAEDYSQEAKYIFNYSFVILFRMLSIPEKFIDPLFVPRGSKMNYLVKVNNKNDGYRSFSSFPITIKGLKRFDDIELVNKKIGELQVMKYYRKQTSIYRTISENPVILTYKKKKVKRKLVMEQNGAMFGCTCDMCESARAQFSS